MFKLVIGTIAGGVIVWVWRDSLRDFFETATRDLRAKAADRLDQVQERTEGMLDGAKSQIQSALQAGKEVIRPSETSR